MAFHTSKAVTTEEHEALSKAWFILGSLGGNTTPSPYRDAWLAMRDVVQVGTHIVRQLGEPKTLS
jgi:hypothetical protein